MFAEIYRSSISNDFAVRVVFPVAGETATVCGSVVSTQYAPGTKRQPTFLNLDKPYPNQVFTVLIWSENRSKFGTPESEYKGKRICVTGKITEYRNVPEIVTEADHGRVSLRHFQTNLNFKTLPRRIGLRKVQPSERTSLCEAANAPPSRLLAGIAGLQGAKSYLFSTNI